ncbi:MULTISPECIES: deazapurine DNA modification protein DpdA family protein [Sphingomonadaceae]|uniref:deazapurine DNA modification protein DpdA family protein n=1 Tax=Sphingomonadales TaxID=204457 RepID=UPI00076FF787|nr:hypothetical protein [Sphingobium sp. TKS]AMK23220.1 hypothetical protein K426_11420 [Sphingobium sp. TKS]MCF8709100.1 hypothetical protein [Rhizorhapis sp. SPR117]
MAIEIMVGLPHLREGPILRRAKGMQMPALISANALSRWTRRRGWPEWLGWNLQQLQHAPGLASLALDSAGFVALAHYGAYPWTVDDYMILAASYPFRWFASMDYCVEPEIARDRDEVLDRIARTIRVNLDCRTRARDLGIDRRLMPVIQGRRPEDYERCLEGLAHPLSPGTLIGIGSMCRRHVAGPDGLVAVFDHLDRVLPQGVLVHAFGVKGTALSYLKGLEHRIASIDSQAYGQAARRDAFRRGIAKTDALVADHMQRWARSQLTRSSGPARDHQRQLTLLIADRPPDDRWEWAIARARAEIRGLVEEGALDHDAMTAGWIEQWAADIYNSAPQPASSV